MGKPTGFLEYERKIGDIIEPNVRIQNFLEFHKSLPFNEQRKQGARCMDCGVPFCQSGMMIGGMISGCPLNNLIPEWNDLVYLGNMEQAYERLKKTNPFPEFTGRVCPALCEKACTCSLHGEAVSIKENEYSIIEEAFLHDRIKPEPPSIRTGKKVAIIGSGPAGLSAAFVLNKRGHEVTVYERSDRIGGLLYYGIPNMKLEKWVIDRRVKLLEEEGVRFITNVNAGIDISVKELQEQYDKILLACGASNPRDISVKGREAKGIYFAVDFLSKVTKSLPELQNGKKGQYPEVKGKDVIVIGGGDTGNDCVGTSIRLGAKSIVQIEMMPKAPEERTADNPWPEWPKVNKTDYGQEEAIAVFGQDPRIYETTVEEFFMDEHGQLKGVKIVKVESKIKDGKRVLEPVKGSERVLKAQVVFIAAGFLGTEPYIRDCFGVSFNQRTSIASKEGSYKTNVPNIYSAGDCRRGQSLVVWAIREGIEVAKEIDEALMS